MKRSLIILFFFLLTFASAENLPAYIAKYDKDLAIELYKDELSSGKERSETYLALANLYNEIGKVGLAEDCYRHLLDMHNDSLTLYQTYLEFLYQNQSYVKLRYVIEDKGYSQDWSQYLVAKSYFQEGKFDSSFQVSSALSDDMAGKLKHFSFEGIGIKYRSPALGGIMSAIIPGSGKVYAGRLFDGFQAFTVVAAPAYNAYYHFSKNGVGSVQAWVWTAVASWFYLSDIYGSIKAVHEYNEMQQLKIIERYEQ